MLHMKYDFYAMKNEFDPCEPILIPSIKVSKLYQCLRKLMEQALINPGLSHRFQETVVVIIIIIAL